MKLIPLTQGRFAKVDDEDYPWLMENKWQAQRMANTWYAVRNCKTFGIRKMMYMHRVILNTGEKQDVDHANRDGLDNQKENLRNCNRSQNLANCVARRDDGLKGIWWRKDRRCWTARIRVYGTSYNLGHFNSKEEAAAAYNIMSKKHFGIFARLNKV